jgi:hypothetical protein
MVQSPDFAVGGFLSDRYGRLGQALLLAKDITISLQIRIRLSNGGKMPGAKSPLIPLYERGRLEKERGDIKWEKIVRSINTISNLLRD